MAQRIAQRFLDDAEDGGIDDVAEPLLVAGDVDREGDVGPAPAPELDEIVDRLSEAEFGKADRPQPSEHRLDLRLEVARGLGDRRGLAGDRRVTRTRLPLDGGGIDFDGEEQRADLVVKIARDIATLLLLQAEEF